MSLRVLNTHTSGTGYNIYIYWYIYFFKTERCIVGWKELLGTELHRNGHQHSLDPKLAIFGPKMQPTGRTQNGEKTDHHRVGLHWAARLQKVTKQCVCVTNIYLHPPLFRYGITLPTWNLLEAWPQQRESSQSLWRAHTPATFQHPTPTQNLGTDQGSVSKQPSDCLNTNEDRKMASSTCQQGKKPFQHDSRPMKRHNKVVISKPTNA